MTDRKKHELFKIRNNSAIPFDVETKKGEKLTIPAEASLILPLNRDDYKDLTVRNLFTGSKSNLKVNLF